MLALCSVLHTTDYAQNYAGIIGTGLIRSSYSEITECKSLIVCLM